MAFDKINKHVVAESSLLKATRTGNIVNLLDTELDVDNGKLVAQGDYISPEVYQMKTPTATDIVYLTLQPPLIYEDYTSLDQNEHNFYNAKGNVVRCYPLEYGDVFTVSENGIIPLGGEVELNNLVIADGRNIKEVDSSTDVTNAFVGKILDRVVKHNRISYRILVLKNTAASSGGSAGEKGDKGDTGATGASVKAIELTVDVDGKVTGGTATLTNDSTLPITVTTV